MLRFDSASRLDKALHEATHAVLGLNAGRRVSRMWWEGREGRTQFVGKVGRAAWLRVVISGTIAELIGRHGAGAGQVVLQLVKMVLDGEFPDAPPDIRKAAQLATDMARGDRRAAQAAVAAQVAQAEERIRRYWAAIAAVASAFADRPELSDEELQDVIAPWLASGELGLQC